MNFSPIRSFIYVFSVTLLLAACSVAKLEARLEANPQCKDVVNPKTGALMPCPGSDKAFYREVGLAPAKPAPIVISPPASAPTGLNTSAAAQTSSSIPQTTATSIAKPVVTQGDCKPQIHKKTGGTLPCPAPD